MSETLATASAPPPRAAIAIPSRAALWPTYATLLRWAMWQIGAMLPIIVVVQAVLGAGIILGFGLLIPGIDAATAAFLSTGAPTVLLMVVGLVMVPQGVAQARTSGTFTYLRALPVPRTLLLLSDLTVWLVVALPSIPIALLVAHWRYGVAYEFDWPVLLLAGIGAALAATAIGYALAVVLPPLLAQLATQVLVFFVMLFSPITFPAAQLPGWLASLHDWLPFRPAGDLLRAGLLEGFEARWQDAAVLALWCALGLVVSIRALSRRG